MIRLAISPSPRTINIPDSHNFNIGKGTLLKDGKEAVIFTYGPVMLNEALIASDLLEKEDFSLKVINMPWLNRVDQNWLDNAIKECEKVFILENHSYTGGLGDFLINKIMQSRNQKNKEIIKFAPEGYPACGTPHEVLSYHGLDGKSLAENITGQIV
jgi:transketolase